MKKKKKEHSAKKISLLEDLINLDMANLLNDTMQNPEAAQDPENQKKMQSMIKKHLNNYGEEMKDLAADLGDDFVQLIDEFIKATESVMDFTAQADTKKLQEQKEVQEYLDKALSDIMTPKDE